jgi:phosphoribosyl 1,2-cyclic phosphodiesterase
MKLKVIGSSSAGNSYILQSNDGHSLIIDCGVNMSEIKKGLGFNLRNAAAIVTHCHGDHAKSVKDVLDVGIPVYASLETFQAIGVKHHRAICIRAGMSCQIGAFKVKPFDVNHDVPCFGFLIQHDECGRVLFLTDTFFSDYTFPGINNIIVECNHDAKILNSNGTSAFLRDRIIQSHMNLETCKDLLRANDLSAVNNIVLIHLSDRNSDAERFEREIRDLTGKSVHVADAGLTIAFDKTPF